MIKYFWCFLGVCIFPFCGLTQELDSIAQREIRTGFHVTAENVSESVLKGNNGFGFEVGAFQERKLLDRVSISYEAGFRYKSYEEQLFLIDSSALLLDPIPDTAIIADRYDIRHDDLKFTSLLSVRFVYLEDPNVYFILGLGPEFTFRQRINETYLNSRFFNEDGELIADNVLDVPPALSDDEFKNSVVNLRIDLGIGIEFKKFNIELVHRTDNTQNLGLRIRYTFDTLIY